MGQSGSGDASSRVRGDGPWNQSDDLDGQGERLGIKNYSGLRQLLKIPSNHTPVKVSKEECESVEGGEASKNEGPLVVDEKGEDLDVRELSKIRLPLDLRPEELNSLVLNAISSRLMPSNTTTKAVPRLLRVLSARLRDTRQSFLSKQMSQNGDSQSQNGDSQSQSAIPVFTSEQEVEAFESLSHLTLLTQLVIKHLSEELPVEELIYQLEHFPVGVKSVAAHHQSNPIPNESRELSRELSEHLNEPTPIAPPHNHSPLIPFISNDLVAVPTACLRVTFMGRYQRTFHVNRHPDFEMQLKLGLTDWIRREAPMHLWMVVHHGCLFRDLADGTLLGSYELQERVLNDSEFSRQVALVPIGLSCLDLAKPGKDYEDIFRYSVVNEVFLEAATFLPLTQTLLLNSDAAPIISRIHTALLEMFLVLFPLISADNRPKEFKRASSAFINEAHNAQEHQRNAKQDPLSEDHNGKRDNVGQSCSKSAVSRSSCYKTLPSYFLDLQPPSSLNESSNMNRLPTTPFLSSFIGLMASLHQPQAQAPNSTFSEIPLAFIRYLLSNLWMNNERVRHIMVQSMTSSDSSSNSSFEDLLGSSPLKILKASSDQFASSLLATRMVNASLSVLSALIFHPTISFGRTDLSDALPPHETPIFLSRRKIEDFKSSGIEKCRVDFVLLNTMSQLFGTVTDTRYFSSSPTATASSSPLHQFTLPLRFDPLLATFCSSRRLSEHLNSLVLYALIYRNRTFRVFCLSRTEIHFLVLPILRILHDIPGASITSSDTTYPPSTSPTQPLSFPIPPAATLLLLVLIILSRDENFSTSIFSTVLTSAPLWYGTQAQRHQLDTQPQSQSLSLQSKLSVGSLSILVLLKFVTWNFSKPHDLFGHELSGGVFCNLAPSIRGLHWLVAERFVSFTSRLIKQLTKRLPPVTLFDDTDDTPIDAHLSLPFDYLNTHVQQLLLRRELEKHQSSSPTGLQAGQQVNGDLVTARNGTASPSPSSTESDKKSPRFVDTKESELSDDPATILILQSTFSILRGILIDLSTSLLPDRISSRAIASQSGSSDTSKSPATPSTTTEMSQDVTVQSTTNLTLLYAFLRSEETVSALQSLQSYASHVAACQRRRKETAHFIQLYTEQYQIYYEYCSALEHNETLKNGSRSSSYEFNTGSNGAMSPTHQLLSSLPRGISRLARKDLPDIPPPPSVQTPPPNSPSTACSIKSFATSACLQFAPHVQYLLDLRTLLLAKPDKSRYGQDDVEDVEDLEVEVALTRLAERCNQLPDCRTSTDHNMTIKTKAVTPVDRLKLFVNTMTPPIPFAYGETEVSSDYFLPLLWKAILMTSPDRVL